MPKVEINECDGGWQVAVSVADQITRVFGPMELREARAFVRGAKAFAMPHCIQFPDLGSTS